MGFFFFSFIFERMCKYKSADKKKCEKSDIFHISARIESTPWPAPFRHIWETPECFQARKSWPALSEIPKKLIKVSDAQNCTLINHGEFYILVFSIKKESVCCLKTFYRSKASCKGRRNFPSACSGCVLWKAGDNLMNKWVNISLEYPSYAGLHKRQWKLKTQQLPPRNFCKSEETT